MRQLFSLARAITLSLATAFWLEAAAMAQMATWSVDIVAGSGGHAIPESARLRITANAEGTLTLVAYDGTGRPSYGRRFSLRRGETSVVDVCSTTDECRNRVLRAALSGSGTFRVTPVLDRVTAVSAGSEVLGNAAVRQLSGASFHAAAFQDPATGLIYNRDRWFDPSSGGFISPDKMTFHDSSSGYAYAGSDPVNSADPSGLYQADFHYGLTYFLALRAGFCDAVARRIAAGTELPDQDPGRAPVRQGTIMKSPRSSKAEKEEARTMLWIWHFPKAERDSGDVLAGSQEAQSIAMKAFAEGSLSVLAQGLHPLQDSWSHRGTPSIDGVAGHPKARGGPLSTKTDQPWRWPDQALLAAEATFNYLAAFRIRYPQQAGGACAKQPALWSSVATEAKTFIALRTKPEKKAWLLRHGVTMPGTYWDDVDK